MSERVSPAVIGAFVVGAFAILVASIMVVGSGKLFKKTTLFVCMFQGDVNGLKIGAPVKFKGVQVGSVTDIRLVLSPKEGQLKENMPGIWLPVIIEIDRAMLAGRGGTGRAITRAGMDEFIKRGLRAQLSVESFLTGLLYVDLDLHPNAPLDLALEQGGELREIPTIPTTLESVQRQAGDALAKFQQIDFNALAVSITEAANSIKSLTSSPQLMATLSSLKDATANLNTTITDMRSTINNINGHIDPLVGSLQRNSVEVDATLKQTRASLIEVQSALDPDSPMAVHLNQALEQLTETMRIVGEFVDYMQRNPSAPLRGKYVPEKDR
jgi:paraquat-inducible protein B